MEIGQFIKLNTTEQEILSKLKASAAILIRDLTDIEENTDQNNNLINKTWDLIELKKNCRNILVKYQNYMVPEFGALLQFTEKLEKEE